MLSKYVWSISVEKISFIRSCDMEEIKATESIIKAPITSGNIKWRSFALRFCATNHKSVWQPLLPSAKDLSFIFVLYLMQESWWSSPFLFTFYPLEGTLCWKDPGIYIQLDVSEHELLLLTLPLRQHYKPLSFSVSDLKLHTHKYCVSVRNCERLNDGWVCGLVEKLLYRLFPMLW